MEKLVQELSPRGRGDLGARPALEHLQLQILVLRLLGELQCCFCFPALEILREEKDLEVSPYAEKLEAPFAGEEGVD